MSAHPVGIVPVPPPPDEPSSSERSRDLAALATVVLAALGTVLALRVAREVVVPFLLAVLISHALEPIVATLVRVRISRPIAAAVVLALLLGGVGAGGYLLQDQAAAFARGLPVKVDQVRAKLRRRDAPGKETIGSVQQLATEIERSAAAAAAPAAAPPGVTPVQIQPKPLDLRGFMWAGSMGLVALAAQAVVVFFLVYFLLATGDLYRRKLVKLVGPSLTRKKITVQVIDEIDRQVQRFLLVRLVASVLIGTASAVAYLALGLEQPVVWGIAAGLLNSIPYFGPGTVTAGATVAAFLQFGTLGMPAAVAVVSLALASIDGFLLVPWLISRASRMNEVAVFVGLLFWGWLWGVIGLFVAVPILMVCKAACDRIEGLRPFGELLGE